MDTLRESWGIPPFPQEMRHTTRRLSSHEMNYHDSAEAGYFISKIEHSGYSPLKISWSLFHFNI